MNNLKLTKMKYGETLLKNSYAFYGGNPDIQFPISLMFYLIEYKNRKILVDVGCDQMPDEWQSNYFIRPVDLLQKYGLSASDITDVVITHGHEDHIGAINYFTNADIYIQKDEYIAVHDYLVQKNNIILFSDEYVLEDAITIKKIGSHSKGSCIVLITTAESTYVLTGDECYVQECLTQQKVTGAVYDIEANKKFLKEYSSPNYTICLFHDIAEKFLPCGNGFEQVVTLIV